MTSRICCVICNGKRCLSFQYPDSCGPYKIDTVRDLTAGYDSTTPDNKPVRILIWGNLAHWIYETSAVFQFVYGVWWGNTQKGVRWGGVNWVLSCQMWCGWRRLDMEKRVTVKTVSIDDSKITYDLQWKDMIWYIAGPNEDINQHQ